MGAIKKWVVHVIGVINRYPWTLALFGFASGVASFVLVEREQESGLYAYTAIRAPRGLNERIFHVWRLDGKQVDRIALDINGGRDAGYRAWTHKLNFPLDSTGNWKIHVITEADQVIGVLRFEVVH